MDLTKSYPRSVKEKVAGVTMLPRTIDKAKAAAVGTLGEYHYDCPMDKQVFGFLGIDSAAFFEHVKAAKNDADIEAYAKQFAAKKSPAEIETFNRGMLGHAPKPGSEGEAYFLELRGEVAPDRTDVTTWPDLLDLDEKREVPRKAAV